MSDAGPNSVKMILPPDGRQTRIDFFRQRTTRKNSREWWQSLSSWFRNDEKEKGTRLDIFAGQLRKKGYSEKSVKSYTFMMQRFFDYYDDPEPENITMGEIEDYNFEFFVSGRYSRSYQLQFINAIKLYYLLTQGVELNLRKLRKSGVGRKLG